MPNQASQSCARRIQRRRSAIADWGLPIGDCGLGIRIKGVKDVVARNDKRTQVARALPAPGNPKHETRNSKQIRNANAQNKPQRAKRTQFAV